jgi:radical SAM protein with 4Fe4S-binding SPASM domain
MSFEEFKYILDQYDNSLRIIYFYFMGESFLNKDAYKMIRYAADRGIYVSACTNGNKIDPEQLVKSGIADIQFQISGTSDETHSRYRVNGKLEGVIGNVKDTLSFRSKLGDRISRTYPMNITLGMILFKHNEHEVSEFRTLADRIGVDQWQIIDPCVRTVEQAHEYLPTDKRRWIYDPKALQKGILAPKRSPINYCEYLYSAMTVQVDGNVVPCCRDVKGRWILGNVFEDDAYTIWNNKKYRSLRKSIAGNQKNLWLCKQCEGYGVPDLKI